MNKGDVVLAIPHLRSMAAMMQMLMPSTWRERTRMEAMSIPEYLEVIVFAIYPDVPLALDQLRNLC
jgi:hypothetical protein